MMRPAQRPWLEGLIGYDPNRVSIVDTEDPDAVTDEELAAMLEAEGPDTAQASARRAYSPDQPRDERGRFGHGTKATEDKVAATEDRGFTEAIQMQAAVAEDVMRRNDIDTVMGKPLTNDEAESMFDGLMEKYAPTLDYQMRVDSATIDQYGGDTTAAFTSRGMTEALPADHPMYGKDVALVYFRDGPRPVEVLHEMAHVIEGSWRAPPDDGHSNQWYRTYYDLTGNEGYPQAQNVLRAVMWDPTLEPGA